MTIGAMARRQRTAWLALSAFTLVAMFAHAPFVLCHGADGSARLTVALNECGACPSNGCGSADDAESRETIEDAVGKDCCFDIPIRAVTPPARCENGPRADGAAMVDAAPASLAGLPKFPAGHPFSQGPPGAMPLVISTPADAAPMPLRI